MGRRFAGDQFAIALLLVGAALALLPAGLWLILLDAVAISHLVAGFTESVRVLRGQR